MSSISQEILREIRHRSLFKKNGVFSHKKYFYAVHEYKLIAYSDYSGNVFECVNSLIVSKGKASDRFDGKKIITNYLKQKLFESHD